MLAGPNDPDLILNDHKNDTVLLDVTTVKTFQRSSQCSRGSGGVVYEPLGDFFLQQIPYILREFFQIIDCVRFKMKGVHRG